MNDEGGKYSQKGMLLLINFFELMDESTYCRLEGKYCPLRNKRFDAEYVNL